MKIVTFADEAAKIARHYGTAPGAPAKVKARRAQLDALGKHPTAKQVNDILGSTQVFLACDVCGTEVAAVAEFSGNWSGGWVDDVVRICPRCLRGAARKLAKCED